MSKFFNYGIVSDISRVATVVGAAWAKVESGPDGGDRMGLFLTVDDEGHSDPE